MATDLERLVVQLSANIKGYENALNRAIGVTNQRANQIESRFNRMNQNVSASFASSLRSSVATIGGALGVREIQQYADAWTEAGNKIRAAATSAGVSARSLNELKDGANDARTDLTSYVDLYARLIRSASGVAKSEKEIALATNVVSKAFKAGSASAAEQASGILQLGQALGSGVLQGDELKSIRENAPILAQAIAKEFKTTVDALKELGAEGKLTSERVFKAIIAAQKPIEDQFKATNATIGDAVTRLNNEFTAYIGNADASAGASRSLVQALTSLADNFRGVADVVVQFATIIATALVGRALAGAVAGIGNAVIALGSFITALRTGTLAAAGFTAALGPIGLLAGAAAGAVLLLYTNMGRGDDAARAFSGAVQTNEPALLNAATASRQYQAELVKQISLQLEAAKAAEAQAQSEFDTARSRVVTFSKLTGGNFRFAPLDYAVDEADKRVGAIQGAVDKLEQQKKRAEDILANNPSGFGGGSGAAASDKGGKGKTKKDRANEFEREIEQIKERTAAIQAETAAQSGINPLINDYGFAVDKARAQQELLNAAKAAGLIKTADMSAATPKLAAQIENLATAYATATAASQQLSEKQDEIRQRAEDAMATAKDVTRGLIDGFVEGKSAADTMIDALKKIGDALIDDVLNNIFKIQNAGGSGGLGGILGGLLGLFGGGGGGIPSGIPGPWGASLPGFANGTSNFPGGWAKMNERGGEIVKLPSGSQIIPHDVSVKAMRGAASTSSGPIVINNNIDARGAQQGVAEQIDAKLNAFNSQLPNRIKQIQNDPRAR